MTISIQNLQITYTTKFQKSQNLNEIDNIISYLQDYDFIHLKSLDSDNLDLVFTDDLTFSLKSSQTNSHLIPNHKDFNNNNSLSLSQTLTSGNINNNSTSVLPNSPLAVPNRKELHSSHPNISITTADNVPNSSIIFKDNPAAPITQFSQNSSCYSQNSINQSDKPHSPILIFFDTTVCYDQVQAEQALIDLNYFELFFKEDIISKDNYIGLVVHRKWILFVLFTCTRQKI